MKRTHGRALEPHERELLNFLLSEPFPGVEELREQALTARAVNECGCGCGTIGIYVPRPLVPKAGIKGCIPVEATGVSPSAPCDVILFVREGYLSCLEVVRYGDRESFPYPGPADLQLIVHRPIG